MKIEKIKLIMLTMIFGTLCLTTQAQEADSKTIIDCISLSMIEQKPAPKSKEKPAPDVIVIVPDDLHIRFELKNKCDVTIYYLSYANPDSKVPAGFMIYRNKENKWEARSPAWGREGNFTGINYKWELLKTGESIEFEYSDLSLIEGERSVAIYVNYLPKHEKRVEVIAIPFTIKKS